MAAPLIYTYVVFFFFVSIFHMGLDALAHLIEIVVNHTTGKRYITKWACHVLTPYSIVLANNFRQTYSQSI